jgi:hypothetical protein
MDAQQTTKTSPILLIVIGIIIGILIAGSFYFAYSFFKNRKSKVSNETKGLLLSVSNPNDNDVVNDKTIAINGSTGKDAVVVVLGATSDLITETSEGNFSAKVDLNEGENLIQVYAFDTTTGESAQMPINLLYIPQKFTSSSTSTDNSNVNSASDSAKSQTTAYINSHVYGKIIAKNDTTFELDSKNGIKAVFTDDLTKFLSADNDGIKDIFIENVGVGDQVSAVGLSSDNTDGLAKYIVKLNKDLPQTVAVMGKVKTLGTDGFDLSYITQSSQTISVKTTDSTSTTIKGKAKAAFSDIKIGDTIIVTGSVDKDTILTTNKLFVAIQSKTKTTPAATPSAGQ